LTFSSLDGLETEVDEFPLDAFVADNRIRFVSFVDVVFEGGMNAKRLIINGVEPGNDIATARIKIFCFNYR
jgi:hypothetical protein